jgi:hypothetical protein
VGYDDNVRQERLSHIAGRQQRRELGGMMVRGMKDLKKKTQRPKTMERREKK